MYLKPTNLFRASWSRATYWFLSRHFMSGLIVLVRVYQALLSPLHGPVCRYQPTCSEYFIEALKAKGVIKGVLKGVWRILRCHPLGGSGYDPI